MNLQNTKFWEDSPGSQSAGRLVFLVLTGWNIIVCSFLILQQTDPLIVSGIFATIQSAAAAQKLIQNNQENKMNLKK